MPPGRYAPAYTAPPASPAYPPPPAYDPALDTQVYQAQPVPLYGTGPDMAADPQTYQAQPAPAQTGGPVMANDPQTYQVQPAPLPPAPSYPTILPYTNPETTQLMINRQQNQDVAAAAGPLRTIHVTGSWPNAQSAMSVSPAPPPASLPAADATYRGAAEFSTPGGAPYRGAAEFSGPPVIGAQLLPPMDDREVLRAMPLTASSSAYGPNAQYGLGYQLANSQRGGFYEPTYGQPTPTPPPPIMREAHIVPRTYPPPPTPQSMAELLAQMDHGRTEPHAGVAAPQTIAPTNIERARLYAEAQQRRRARNENTLEAQLLGLFGSNRAPLPRPPRRRPMGKGA